jgi:hypothetical protein
VRVAQHANFSTWCFHQDEACTPTLVRRARKSALQPDHSAVFSGTRAVARFPGGFTMLISRSAAAAATLAGFSMLTGLAHAQCTGWKSIPRPAGVYAALIGDNVFTKLDFGPPGPVGDMIVSSGYMCTGPYPTLNCHDIYLFNGTDWSNLGRPTQMSGNQHGYVTAAAPLNRELIIGGSFSAVAGAPARNLAIWRDGAWSEFGGGTANFVRSLFNWSGEIVAAGAFREIGGVPTTGVARWDGQTWHDLGLPANPGGYAFLMIYRGALSVVSVESGYLLSFVNGAWIQITQSPIGSGKVWVVVDDHIMVGRYASNGSDNTAIWNGSSWQVTNLPRESPITGDTSSEGLAAYDVDRDGNLGAVCNSFVSYWIDRTTIGSTIASSSGTQLDIVMGEGNSNTRTSGPLTVWAGELWSNYRRFVNGFPTVYVEPTDTTACGRRTAAFSTIITNTLSAPTYRWQRNGIDVADGPTPWGSTILGSTSADLTIRSPRPKDLGTYRCIITNGTCGSTQTRDAQLTGCQADINCDGQSDFNDYLDFIDNFANETPAADFDANGTVDFFDYLDFVETFARGC